MTDYVLTGLVVLLTLGIYFWMIVNVGKARSKHGIKAPEISGNEDFNRVMRVPANTVEQLWLFIPLLVMFAMLWGDMWAALIGVFFPIGRIIYARGYYAVATKRGLGFSIGFFTIVALFLGVLVGYALELWDSYGM